MLCFAVLGQDYFCWRRRHCALFSSHIDTSSRHGHGTGNYGDNNYNNAAPHYRYFHPAESNFRQFLDDSLARAASAAFRGFSAGGTGEMLTAFVDGGLDVVAAAHHPIFGKSQAAVLATTVVTGQLGGRGGGAAVMDMQRDPLPAELSPGFAVQVNLPLDSHSAPHWRNATIERRILRDSKFAVRAESGGEQLVVPLGDLRWREKWGSIWSGRVLSSADYAYLKPGLALEARASPVRWINVSFVATVAATTMYTVLVGDWRQRTARTVAHTQMRRRLTAQQLASKVEQRERERREADQRFIEKQCLLHDTANVHLSPAWERGSRTVFGVVAQEVWSNLVGIIGDITRATDSANLNELQWSDAALLAKQDSQLRALAAKLPTFSAPVTAHFPCDPLRALPTPCFEQRLYRHVEELQAAIQATRFVGHEKLQTLNESDKQVCLPPPSTRSATLPCSSHALRGGQAHCGYMPLRGRRSLPPATLFLCGCFGAGVLGCACR
jgi:hypothetical protein